MTARPADDDIAYLTALVREHDRPRYYATLFAPAEARADLFALYGFAAEIARVPDQVREPGLGEVRLRWWQDSFAEATGSGDAGIVPAVRGIAKTIKRHRLPLAPFEALIEARSADLYSDPPATLADVEGRMGETESALFQMAAIILGAEGPETAEAAGHAGIAYGLARRLAAFASEHAKRRTILPADLLARAGLTAADLFVEERRLAAAPALMEMVAHARRHLGEGQREIRKLASPVRDAFLPLANVASLLRRIERLGINAVHRDGQLSDFPTLAHIAAARLVGV